MTRAALLLAHLMSIVLLACSPGAVTQPLATPPKYDFGGAKCKVKSSQSRPLIVEWSSSDRASLEAQVKKGVVAVRYDGCEMEVLRQCRAKSSYGYVPITPKHDQVVIRDADELYASLPLGAAKLEAKLERAGQLNVSTMVVGTWEATDESVSPDELEGDCKRATHVIVALTVGAFDFYAGATAGAGAEASVAGFGGGAKSRSERQQLVSDGDLRSCAGASNADRAPPNRCGALIRVEVLPLGQARVVQPKPVLDLGEVLFLGRGQRPEMVMYVGYLPVDSALVAAELEGEARAAWKSVKDDDERSRELGLGLKKAFDELEACRRTGCSEERKLQRRLEELEARRAKSSQGRAAREQAAIKRLEGLAAAAKPSPSPALLFALAMLQKDAALALYDDESAYAAAFDKVTLLFRRASAASVDSAIGWWSRYQLGISLAEIGKFELAIEPLTELVRGPERPGRDDAAYRLGTALDAVLRPGPAVDAYKTASRSTQKGLQQVALWSLVMTAFRAERWKDSLEAAIRLHELHGEELTEVVSDIVSVPATAVLRLGGLEREQLRTAQPEEVAWIAMRFAEDALARSDLLGAARAWELVAERAPDTLQAPLALASLAQAYEALDDAARAAAARKKLNATYTMTSPWADALRKRRTKSGKPSDEALRQALAASPPPLPPVPKTPGERSEDIGTRVGGLVTSCMPSALTPNGVIQFAATVTDGKPVTVDASLVEGKKDMEAVVRCVERDAPFFFSGASNSVKVRAKLSPTG